MGKTQVPAWAVPTSASAIKRPSQTYFMSGSPGDGAFINVIALLRDANYVAIAVGGLAKTIAAATRCVAQVSSPRARTTNTPIITKPAAASDHGRSFSFLAAAVTNV
jgi:hypothetical protein